MCANGKQKEAKPVELVCICTICKARSNLQRVPVMAQPETSNGTGSVSCERSFSALRRLKLWTRSSMTEERLSGLAMMLIHRQRQRIFMNENQTGDIFYW